MTDATANEILEWSKGRPAWQRDALRRLFATGTISSDEIDELTELCKAANGLAPPRGSIMLEPEHLRTSDTQTTAVALLSVKHLEGVNALAPDQTVSFGSQLTVVYGQNAAGKSGYTRILKKACRSRSTEGILGDVIAGGRPLRAQATIRYTEGASEFSHPWRLDQRSPAALTAVSVFDSHSAGVYLRDKTDVAFRPFGLDIFDKLSRVCDDVRFKLEREQGLLYSSAIPLPSLAEGTRAQRTIVALTALTNVDSVRQLAAFKSEETSLLSTLRERQRDLRAADPKARSRELLLQARRIDRVVEHLAKIERVAGTAALAKVAEASQALSVATAAVEAVRVNALRKDFLSGTGEALWREMWAAARAYSAIAYPDRPFPAISDGARCPFCQQDIAADAASRLIHLQEFASSSAQAELERAETVLRERLSALGASIDLTDLDLIGAEIGALTSTVESQLQSFIAASIGNQRAALDAVSNRQDFPKVVEAPNPASQLKTIADSLRTRAEQLASSSKELSESERNDLLEMEARTELAKHLPAVEKEIERKKRLAVYNQCIEETRTKPITLKSTELTKKLVTEQLQGAFKNELAALGFTHLAIEVQAAGGAKGEMFHRLAFANAPTVDVTDVLSEGESRALALAAFMTELTTAPSVSAIIFDDPVSSLDHVWRERIADRLIQESTKRQVIVFTHDLVFLKTLKDGAEKQGTACSHQYVRRSEGQGAGLSSNELPWVAMGVRERLGVLRGRWQAADKLHRTSDFDSYERDARDIYGLLREAWEQAVAEVLLNDVVGRYRPSIETRKVRHLHDITPEDCKTVDNEMTDCSRWIRGHDQAAADGTPFPPPAALYERIEAIDAWIKVIRKRRA